MATNPMANTLTIPIPNSGAEIEIVACAAIEPNPPPVVVNVTCVWQSLSVLHVEALGAVMVKVKTWLPAFTLCPKGDGVTALQDHPVHVKPVEQATEAVWARPLPLSHVEVHVTVCVCPGFRLTEFGHVTDSAANAGVTSPGTNASADRTRQTEISSFVGFITA